MYLQRVFCRTRCVVTVFLTKGNIAGKVAEGTKRHWIIFKYVRSRDR